MRHAAKISLLHSSEQNLMAVKIKRGLSMREIEPKHEQIALHEQSDRFASLQMRTQPLEQV